MGQSHPATFQFPQESKHKYLFIVEGPAGSGKTTLTTELEQQKLGLVVVRGTMGARSFLREEGIALSAVNDYSKCLKAVVHPLPVVVVERLVVSQYVYGTLRTPKQSPPLDQMYADARLLVETARADLSWRSGFSLFQHIHLIWIVVLPSVAAITKRRETQPDRSYPWPVNQEFGLYEQAFKALPQPHLKIETDFHGKGMTALVQWMRQVVAVYESGGKVASKRVGPYVQEALPER